MRGLYLVLLTGLLCSEHALSLRCYNCPDVGNTCNTTVCEAPSSVCFTSHLTLTTFDGQSIKLHPGGCAPSCGEAKRIVGNAVKPVEETLTELGVKSQVGTPTCCERDLCNGVAQAGRSLWALAGGLLLSVGPTLLWALL